MSIIKWSFMAVLGSYLFYCMAELDSKKTVKQWLPVATKWSEFCDMDCWDGVFYIICICTFIFWGQFPSNVHQSDVRNK